MTDTSNDVRKDVLDVVEDFDYSTQNSSYNEKFKKWRKNKDNRHAFRFEGNKKEKVFNDSRGFEKRSPEAVEKKIINRVMYVLGIAMLIFIVIDNSANRLLAPLFRCFGINVHASMLSAAVYGNVTGVVEVLLLASALKIIIPVIYIQLKLKMPLSVGYMSHVNSTAEIVNSVGMALVACTVVCLPTAYSSDTKEIYTLFKSANADVSLWGQREFVVYALFTLVVFPAVYELFLHGPIFAALRQFGDRFAIAVTTVAACLLADTPSEIPATFLISLLAAVSMLRSGTIMTAFIINIIYKSYTFALIMFENENTPSMLLKRNVFMIAALVAGVAVSGSIYIVRRRKGRKLHFIAAYKSEVSPLNRGVIAVKSFPFAAVVMLCILEMVIGVVF